MRENISFDIVLSHKISNLEDLRKKKKLFSFNNFFLIPDLAAGFLAYWLESYTNEEAIVIGSNFGEVASKVTGKINLTNQENDLEKIKIAQHFNPNAKFIDFDPLKHKFEKYDNIVVSFYNQPNKKNEGEKVELIKNIIKQLSADSTLLILVNEVFLWSEMYKNIRSIIFENSNLKNIHYASDRSSKQHSTDFAILEIQRGKTSICHLKLISYANKIINSETYVEIKKEDLKVRWDFNYQNPDNRSYEEKLQGMNTIKLQNLGEIFNGVKIFEANRKLNGNYRLLSPRNIINGSINEKDNDKTINDLISKQFNNALLQNGDIIVSRFNKTKSVVYFHNKDDKKYIADNNFIIIRGKYSSYLSILLKTRGGLNIFLEQIKRFGKGIFNNISRVDLENIQIPLLPVSNIQYASENSLNSLKYSELLEVKNEYKSLKEKFEKNQDVGLQLEILKKMESTLMSVLNRLERIESKLDNISLYLTELVDEFQEIKKLPSTLEEKLDSLSESLDKKLSHINIEQNEIDIYVLEIKKWLEQFDLLENNSQRFLPQAEYIFDKISNLKNADFSPFVIQYCRALENELLNKLFRAYVQTLIDRQIVIETYFLWDLSKNEKYILNNENTYKLATHLIKCINKPKEEWYFELGSMEMGLRYLTGKTVKKSPLLQDLKDFVLTHFEQELLDLDYLNNLKDKIIGYRNQSAHPNFIDTNDAIEFRIEIQKCIIKLMKTYKSS